MSSGSGGFAYDEPEDLNASPWLSKSGTFHFLITAQDPAPLNKEKTSHIDGLKITIAVLAGTDGTQFQKQSEQILFRGKPTDKDGGKFANTKLHKLFVATGLKNGLNPGQKTALDTSLLVTRQFVAEIEARDDGRGNVRHQIKGDRIYHVDDPEVANVPKNAEALNYIPAELRRSPSSFTPMGAGGNGAGGQAAAPLTPHKPVNPMELLQGSAKQPAPTTPPAPAAPAATVPAVNPADV